VHPTAAVYLQCALIPEPTTLQGEAFKLT